MRVTDPDSLLSDILHDVEVYDRGYRTEPGRTDAGGFAVEFPLTQNEHRIMADNIIWAFSRLHEYLEKGGELPSKWCSYPRRDGDQLPRTADE